MILKSIFFLSVLLPPRVAFAQMADSSFFSGKGAVNPAVIGTRKLGKLVAGIKLDRVKKSQTFNTEESFFFSGTGETQVDIQDLTIFRGGNASKGLFTSEATFDYTRFDKKIRLISDNEDIETKSSGFTYRGNASLGIGRYLGFSYTHIKYRYKEVFRSTFQGNSVSFDSDTEITDKDYKIGVRGEYDRFSFATFFQQIDTIVDSYKQDGQAVEGSGKETLKILGTGLSYKNETLHAEIGYERYLKRVYNFNSDSSFIPTRLTFIIEMLFGKLGLGYTGKYIRGGFLDIEKILYNQVIYENSYQDSRLENSFKFSFGQSKGTSFSGIISYSNQTSQEKNNFVGTDKKHETKTTAVGISLKYGYKF